MITTAFLVMQFIISAKAGLVNAVEGTTNVRVHQQVLAGSPIETGPSGHVEVLLNPGTFMRLGEDSQAVLDSVDLSDVQVRILAGSAIIECNSVEKDSPIRVTDGTETLSISKPGTYRFPEDAVPASLDDWNQQRSELIAAANARSAETDAASNNPAFPSQVLPIYPGYPGYSGSLWPNGLVPGAASPFAYYSPFYGGYSFYRPLIPMPPVVLYPSVIFRPQPRPAPVAHPPITRPTSPSRPGPPRFPGRAVSRGHR